MKMLSNAASRLKDSTYNGIIIGIGANVAKKSQAMKGAYAVQETPTKKIMEHQKSFQLLSCNPEIY